MNIDLCELLKADHPWHFGRWGYRSIVGCALVKVPRLIISFGSGSMTDRDDVSSASEACQADPARKCQCPVPEIRCRSVCLTRQRLVLTCVLMGNLFR